MGHKVIKFTQILTHTLETQQAHIFVLVHSFPQLHTVGTGAHPIEAALTSQGRTKTNVLGNRK